jgi:hypothetical protein
MAQANNRNKDMAQANNRNKDTKITVKWKQKFFM